MLIVKDFEDVTRNVLQARIDCSPHEVKLNFFQSIFWREYNKKEVYYDLHVICILQQVRGCYKMYMLRMLRPVQQVCLRYNAVNAVVQDVTRTVIAQDTEHVGCTKICATRLAMVVIWIYLNYYISLSYIDIRLNYCKYRLMGV